MPTIHLPPKKKYKREKTESKRDNLNHKSVYNTTTWRGLRIEYLKEHPLCEVCLEKEKITAAIDVHHKIPISEGTSMKDKQALGFDWNNLQTVCKQCHKEQHLKKTF